ncbi:MAG: ABC transporter substrate-binding protein [Hyphomicrobiaceae bacterium]|nr:ABC transporter substrate-binding protein [Hyphomicrobiaceae bacterium]
MTGGRGPVLTRRDALIAAGSAAALMALPGRAGAQTPAARHGLSIFGAPRLPADFSHFPFVDPAAPKGGRMVFMPPSWANNQDPETFNTLNGYTLRGEAPPRIELLFDSLMVASPDEEDSVYGLLAESVTLSEDGLVARFALRQEARFHDGTPVTAEDVAASYTLLKDKGHPTLRSLLRDLEAAAAVDAATVDLVFSANRARDAVIVASVMPVFSKAYYAERDFEAASLEAPLGSGPYRIGAMEPGRFIDFAREPDYWGRDLPVNRGRFNFDTLRIEFFRDRQIAFEAFKKGDVTFREEFSSRGWSVDYNFPAVNEGRIRREVLPDGRPAGAQGFFLNLRRAKFADIRVRKALDLCFDFEWSNANLFYGLYRRTHSFFENSAMKAEGPPSPEELALLEPFRDALSPEVFGTAYVPPVSDGSGRDRRLLAEADRLLTEAGYRFSDGRRVGPDGVPLSIEFLAESSLFERIISPYIESLRLIGIEGTYRLIDSANYQLRMKTFDFDVISRRYALGLTPGTGMRQLFGSEAAQTEGSDNLSGIAHPVIDTLIDEAARAESRAALTTLCRALDRVLRAEHAWVPQWFKASHNIAFWDLFGRPETKPAYDLPVETTWWFDSARAAATGHGG